jgi:hypothetical protein
VRPAGPSIWVTIIDAMTGAAMGSIQTNIADGD